MERGPSPEQHEAEQWHPPIEVYISDLAAYNQGRLHGVWVDFCQDPEDIGRDIAYMLSRSPVPDAEEYAFHDYSGYFGLERELGEYPDINLVHEIAEGIEEHGEAFARLCALLGVENAEDLRTHWNDYYRGEWESLRAYAEETWSDLGYEQYIEDIPEEVRMFVTVDYDDFGTALSMDQHVVELENGHIVVFDTRL